MVGYLKTTQMTSLKKLNGGMLWLLPDVFIKICTLIALITLWRVVMLSNADAEMTMEQMLCYTYLNALLADMMVVKSPASGWLSEGVLLQLFGRPKSVLGQLIAITVGGWVPMLLMFSLPMALISPLLGIHLLPASLWFVPSLLLCISLGFAVDMLFACLSIKLRNMSWMINQIRTAIVALFSGTIIPIRLLPLGLDQLMKYQPFAYLGGAPLSIFTGAALPYEIIAMQVFWNLILWSIALFVMKKSQEGMVSYGG